VRPSSTSAYLLKLDPQGQVVFATYLPGPATSVVVDLSGAPFVVTGDGGPVDANQKAYVAAFDAVGASATLQLIPICPPVCGLPNKVALDADGNFYVAGGTSSRNFPVTPGAFQTIFKARQFGTNGFILKMNPRTGNVIYATYLGGSGSDSINTIAVDAAGNAYVGGEAESTDFPVTPSAYWTTPPQINTYGFVTKLNPSGSALAYSTYFTYVRSLRVDKTGATLVATSRINKLSPNGRSLIFQTSPFGFSSVAVDPPGNLIALGSYSGTDFPHINPLQPVSGNTTPPITCYHEASEQTFGFPCADAVIAKFTADGQQILWSSTYGGRDGDGGVKVVVDGAGSIYAWVAVLPLG
jgi:hypothetical protein